MLGNEEITMSEEFVKSTGKKKIRTSPECLEENLKKGITELLILFLLQEKDMYINEITDTLLTRSGGRLNITFPYAVIYRLLDAHYIELGDKCQAPDGRRRQYYRTTEAGNAYLQDLLSVLDYFMGGVYQILGGKVGESRAAGSIPKTHLSPSGEEASDLLPERA